MKGDGKSYTATRMIAFHLSRSPQHFCVSNVPIFWKPLAKLAEREFGRRPSRAQFRRLREENLVEWYKLAPPGTAEAHTFVVIDEGTMGFDARMPITKEMLKSFEFIGHSRHVHIDILVLTQRAQFVQKRIRDHCQSFLIVRNMKDRPLPWFEGIKCPLNMMIVSEVDSKGVRVRKDSWYTIKAAWFKAYDSYSSPPAFIGALGKRPPLPAGQERREDEMTGGEKRRLSWAFSTGLLSLVGVVVLIFMNASTSEGDVRQGLEMGQPGAEKTEEAAEIVEESQKVVPRRCQISGPCGKDNKQWYAVGEVWVKDRVNGSGRAVLCTPRMIVYRDWMGDVQMLVHDSSWRPEETEVAMPESEYRVPRH